MPSEKPANLFGLWVQLRPCTLLKGEGIMVVLAEIIKAATARSDTKVVVAMAKWTEQGFLRLLEDYNISPSKVEIVLSRQRLPLLLRMRQYFLTRHERSLRQSILRRVFQGMARATARVVDLKRMRAAVHARLIRIITTDSTLTAGSYAIAAALLGPLLGLPVLFLWCLKVVLLQNVLAKKLRAAVQHLRHQWFTEKLALMRMRTFQWLAWAYQEMIEEEFRLLARKAGARTDIPVWYVAHPSAVQAAEIGRPIVVAVPDLVYADFATVFDNSGHKQLDERIRNLINRATVVVSYCEYVRQEHVVRQLGVDIGSTRVVPHAAMDLGRHLEAAEKQHGGCVRSAALSLIHSHMRTKYQPASWTPNLPRDYLARFPFDEVKFLFVCSQIRPHKNYLNLFRAFEILLRRKHLNLKLFFTGRLELDTPETNALRAFLRKAHLDLDVISVPDLPPSVQCAFYHLAKLTVVPTCFEGGLPFPFAESLSLGTPVVMSSIPVTRQALPPDLADITLFDPYDASNIAERIAWGLKNRPALLECQKPFYNQYRLRSWDRVLDEYLDVFRQAATDKGLKREGNLEMRGSVKSAA